MLAKWQGIDMQAVYAEWAESLPDISLGAIGYAIDRAKTELEHPPSLSEFRKICLDYIPPETNVMKITCKMTEEQKQKNRERMDALVAQFVKKAAM